MRKAMSKQVTRVLATVPLLEEERGARRRVEVHHACALAPKSQTLPQMWSMRLGRSRWPNKRTRGGGELLLSQYHLGNQPGPNDYAPSIIFPPDRKGNARTTTQQQL